MTEKPVEMTLDEIVKLDSFKEALSVELNKIAQSRKDAEAGLFDKQKDPMPARLKSHPIDKFEPLGLMDPSALAREYARVICKQSELPRSVRDLVEVIGYLAMQRIFKTENKPSIH